MHYIPILGFRVIRSTLCAPLVVAWTPLWTNLTSVDGPEQTASARKHGVQVGHFWSNYHSCSDI